YSRTASIFTFADVLGMTTIHRLPTRRQAYAMACPKLPDEAVMMSGWGTVDATLYAARNLKLPVCWNASLTIVRSTPSRSESRGAEIRVVGRPTADHGCAGGRSVGVRAARVIGDGSG